MRLVVTGGRNYGNTARIFAALDDLHAITPITTLIHGDASGADRRCGAWAYRRGVPVKKFPAQWDDVDSPQSVIRYRRDGKPYDVMAGARRNQQMIDEGRPDAGMAFPGGTGTADMRSRILSAELELFEVS